MALRYLTAGESHGAMLVGILEGLPAGIPVSQSYLIKHQKRRQAGFGRSNRQNFEKDLPEVMSGLRAGMTLGSPISVLLRNLEFDQWKSIMDPFAPINELASLPSDTLKKTAHVVSTPRPGHADLIGSIKYQHEDLRNVLERASARETAIRVSLGSFARCFLSHLGIEIYSRVIQLGEVKDLSQGLKPSDYESLDEQPLRVYHQESQEKMIAKVLRAQEEGDTLGGVFEVVAFGVPLGLGSYVHWDRRLEGQLAQGLMALNGIKSVQVGTTDLQTHLQGSLTHDPYTLGDQGEVKCNSNRKGGIEGGMSSLDPIVLRCLMKPLATLKKGLPSVELKTGEPRIAHFERSDVTAVPSAGVIGESLVAFVLANAILEKFGGDHLQEVQTRLVAWKHAVVQKLRY